jgi:hypothetical protein
MKDRRRQIVFKRPLSSRVFGMDEVPGKVPHPPHVDGGVPVPKEKQNMLMGFIEIFLLTVGAGVFALPKAMEFLNSPLVGIGLTLLAGLIVLFSHYAILRASPYNIVNIKDINPDEDVFVRIVDERFKNPCCSCFKYIFFDFTRWFLLSICSIAYFEIITSYLNQLTGNDLKEMFHSGSLSDPYNPMLWLIVIMIAACILTIMTLICNEEDFEDDTRIKRFSQCFKTFKRITLALASIATTYAITGIITKYARRIDLNTLWSHLVGAPQDVIAGQDMSYVMLMYIGSIFPSLCISFLNHIGGTSKLYEYLHIDKTKLGENNEGKGRYNFFPDIEDKCCKSFYKSRMFLMIILQFVFTTIYFSVPVIALLGSGGSVDGNVLLSLSNTDDGGAIAWLVCSGFGVFAPLCFQYTPILVISMRKSILTLIKPCHEPQNRIFIRIIDSVLAVITLIVSCFLAVYTPANLDIWMGLAGSLCASMIMLVFPALIHLITLKNEYSKKSNSKGSSWLDDSSQSFLASCIGVCCCLDKWKFSEFFSFLPIEDYCAGFLSILTIIIGLVILIFGTWWNILRLLHPTSLSG